MKVLPSCFVFWEVPCSNFNPDKRLYLFHPFLSFFMTVHFNNFLTSTGYLYFRSCLKFSITASGLMNSPFSIYVAVPRQGLLVRKSVPSASKRDRMQNLCRKSVSTSSICVHFISSVQRKNKQPFWGVGVGGGGGCAADT